MSRPTVVVLEPIAASAIEKLQRVAEVMLPDATQGWEERADGLIIRISRLSGEMIGRAKRLKVIGKHGVGVDNIDLAAAEARGITVVSTPGTNANAVAELAVGQMLALLRAIPAHDRALRIGDNASVSRVGRELSAMRVGLVGFGDIARRVAKMVSFGFGAKVGVHTRSPIDAGGLDIQHYPSIEALAAASDILSIHAPLNAATRNLIDARVLACLPHGAFLVNTARGGIVDEQALEEALRSGRLAGAASDVFEIEPPPASHPLLALPNFIASPHIGASTAEALERMGDMVVDRVLEVLASRSR